MGNGNYWLTEAEWQRIEEPLLQLDPAFEEFAKQFDLQIKKNHKGDPNRSVEWGKKIRLLIQVYLENPDNLTFNLLALRFTRSRRETILEDRNARSR